MSISLSDMNVLLAIVAIPRVSGCRKSLFHVSEILQKAARCLANSVLETSKNALDKDNSYSQSSDH
jgi:hypothetical protein